MKFSRTMLWPSLSLAALGVAACDVFITGRPRHDPVYVQPQPVYIEPEPQYVIVQQAPPTIIVERRPPPPSGAHIWIEGSWRFENQRYTWDAGRYALPPQSGMVWVAARYDHDSHGYRYSPGQWRKQDHNNDHDHH